MLKSIRAFPSLSISPSSPPPPPFPDSIICCCELHWAAEIKAARVKSSVGTPAAAFNAAVFTKNRSRVTFNADTAEMESSKGQGHFPTDVPVLWKLIIHQRQSLPCSPYSYIYCLQYRACKLLLLSELLYEGYLPPRLNNTSTPMHKYIKPWNHFKASSYLLSFHA